MTGEAWKREYCAGASGSEGCTDFHLAPTGRHGTGSPWSHRWSGDDLLLRPSRDRVVGSGAPALVGRCAGGDGAALAATVRAMPGTASETGLIAYWSRDTHASLFVTRIASVILIETRFLRGGHELLLDRRPGAGWQRMEIRSDRRIHQLGTVLDGVFTAHAEIPALTGALPPGNGAANPLLGLFHVGAAGGTAARFEDVRFSPGAG